MSLLYQTSSFHNKLSLPYFIPKPLKSDSLYEAFVRFSRKREVDLEFKGMLLSQTEQSLQLLNRLETRFWIYDQASPISHRNFVFRYKAFNPLSNQLVLADRKQIKTLSNSFIYSYNARKYLLQHNTKNYVVKSRPLALTKMGLELSFFGKRALGMTSKLLKRGKISYKVWLVLNLSCLGRLHYFILQKWKINSITTLSRFEKDSFQKKLNYYYHQNSLLNSYILLSKKR